MGVPDARRRIAEAALELFTRRPCEEVTVKEICRRAGCARSTFYEHFQNKAGVLHYLFTEQFAWPDGVEEKCYPHPVEALLASPRRFVELQLAIGPRTMRRYFKAQLDGRDGFFENHREHNGRLTALVRRAQHGGLITSPCAAAELACLSIFTLSHLSMAWACTDGSFDWRPRRSCICAASMGSTR